MYYFGCTINGKINGTPKGVYSPISKLHSILAVAILLAHNNITISYYVQVNSLRWGFHLLCCWYSRSHSFIFSAEYTLIPLFILLERHFRYTTRIFLRSEVSEEQDASENHHLLRGTTTQNLLIFQLCFIMLKIKLYVCRILCENCIQIGQKMKKSNSVYNLSTWRERL